MIDSNEVKSVVSGIRNGRGYLKLTTLVIDDIRRRYENCAETDDDLMWLLDETERLTTMLRWRMRTPVPGVRGEWLAHAMMLVYDFPEWSNAQIAREVGKSPSTQCSNSQFQRFADWVRDTGEQDA